MTAFSSERWQLRSSTGRRLDAAERVMAEHGYQGATVVRVVEEASIPMSSV